MSLLREVISIKDTTRYAMKKLEPNTRDTYSYWLFVLPAFLIYISVVAFPTIFSVILSMTNHNGGGG